MSYTTEAIQVELLGKEGDRYCLIPGVRESPPGWFDAEYIALSDPKFFSKYQDKAPLFQYGLNHQKHRYYLVNTVQPKETE